MTEKTIDKTFFEKFRADGATNDFDFARIGKEVGLSEAKSIAQEIQRALSSESEKGCAKDMQILVAELTRRDKEIKKYQKLECSWKVGVADLKAGHQNESGIIPNRFQYHATRVHDGRAEGGEAENAIDLTTGEFIFKDYGHDIAAYWDHVDEVNAANSNERLIIEVQKDSYRVVPIDLQDKVTEGGDFTVDDLNLLESAGWRENEVKKLVGAEPLSALLATKTNNDEVWNLDDLLTTDIMADEDAIFGPLRKHEGAIIGAGTGIGKSVAVNQLVVGFASNRPEVSFGLKSHVGSLRQLVIQAENDKTANAKAIQGIFEKYKFSERDRACVGENVKWKRWRGQHLRGNIFLNRLEEEIEKSKPQVVWVDPLIAFFEGSLRDDEKCMEFFYSRVDEIMVRTDTNIVFVHHTPKGSTSRPPAKGCELAQVLNGSSYIANWAREVFILEEVFRSGFERRTAKLSSTKRLEGQAGFKAFGSGEQVDEIVIQHGVGGVYWEQRSDPKQVKQAAKNLTPEDKRDKFEQYFIESFNEIGGDRVPKNEIWTSVKNRVRSEEGLTQTSVDEVKSEIEKKLGVHEDYLNKTPPKGCAFRLCDANKNGSGKRLVERGSQK